MEKVEKLLLLVVLGAAMIIMSVMSFGTEGPEKSPKDGASGQNVAKVEGTNPHQNLLPGDPGSPRKRRVDDLLPDVEDGPAIETLGKPGSEPGARTPGKPGSESGSEPGARKDDAAGNGGGSGTGQPGAVPSQTPGTGTGLDAPKQEPGNRSKGVKPAVLALEPSEEPGMWTYRVQAGDTMGAIAKRFTGSPRNAQELIASFNEGLDLDRIGEGQVIQIPDYLVRGKSQQSTSGKSISAPLAKRHAVPGVLQTGPRTRTTRRAPAPAVAGRVAPKTEEHVIRKGETLWSIAMQRVGKSQAMAFIRRIQDLNPGLDPAGLRPKDHILLPAR